MDNNKAVITQGHCATQGISPMRCCLLHSGPGRKHQQRTHARTHALLANQPQRPDNTSFAALAQNAPPSLVACFGLWTKPPS